MFDITTADYDKTTVILECAKTETENDEIIGLMKKYYQSRMEVVRGGSVAVEAVSKVER